MAAPVSRGAPPRPQAWGFHACAGSCTVKVFVMAQPVFADPSGRRRRLLRRVGVGAAAVLALCMGAVVVAMAGGPQAPFTDWAARLVQPSGAASQIGGSHAPSGGHGSSPADAQGGAAPSPSAQLPPGGKSSSPPVSGSPGPSSQPPRSGSPSPSVTPSGSGSPSPTPTQPGHTPPGHSKSPNPHKSNGR